MPPPSPHAQSDLLENKEFSIPNIIVLYAVICMTAIKFHRLIFIVYRRAVSRLYNIIALIAMGKPNPQNRQHV